MKSLFIFLLFGLLLLTNGCVTRRPDSQVRPLSTQEQQSFFARAQDERRFWLTRYETDHGPMFAGAHRVHAERFARAEFSHPRHATLPMIPVRLRYQNDYNALIDTSSPANWIQFGAAIHEGVIPVGPPPHRLFPAHVNDPIPGFLSVASRLTIDPIHVETTLLYVKAAHGPLTYLERHPNTPNATLVLGSEFIRAFQFVQINFPSRLVIFSTTTPFTPDPDRLIASVPMQSYYGIIAVEGVLDDVETPFLLDSIGDFMVATEHAGTTIRHVSIGDLVLRNIDPISMAEARLGLEEIPRIGRRILERYVVTFDTEQALVHFERPH